MKRLLVLLFIPFLLAASPPAVLEGDTQTFLGPVKVVGEIYQWIHKILSTTSKVTTEAITLYVETTGDDDNDCLSVGTACLTVQEAVNRIPKNVQHNVQITVGSGTFAGFVLGEFNVGPYPVTMIVEGTLAEPTLASGGKTNATSDAAGGGTSTLADADGGWNVNELRGMSVQVGTVRRVVRSNTATLITFAAPFSSTCNNKVYQVLEQKTAITPIAAGSLTASVHVYGNRSTNSGLIVSKFALLPSSTVHYGAVIMGNSGFTFRETMSAGTSGTGFQVQDNPGSITMWNVVATGSSTGGINLLNCPCLDQLRLFAYANTGWGITIQSGSGLGTFSVQLTADGNGNSGIHLQSVYGFTHTTSGFIGQIAASDNTGPGLIISGGAVGAVGNSMTGTGNSTVGVQIESFGRLLINGLPTITGASGNFTMDAAGIVTGTWATDLSASGDSVNNLRDGSWIIRR